jgi:ABC-type lipoprotein export system ATPase subunit
VNELLEFVGLAERRHARIRQLSAGQQQRVALARAVVYRPRLLLLDEPTASLDNASKERLLGMVRDLAERDQITMVYVTHDEREAFGPALSR